MTLTQEEFQEKLASAADEPCWVGGVTKYQHVERLGSTNVEGLLDDVDGVYVVQEKIDGANLSVWAAYGQICIASRNRMLYGPELNRDLRTLVVRDSSPEDEDGFRGAVEYILGHKGIATFLSINPDWILRGEWLVKHTVVYSPWAWNKFYVFDVQRTDGTYVPVLEYAAVLCQWGIQMVPHLRTFSGAPSLAELQEIAAQPSDLGAPKREGVVVKRYDFVNRFGRTQWGKVVNADFAEAHRTEQCTEKDPAEIRFVARCVTDDLIRKTIGKIEDASGQPFETKGIGELIGRVWHDAFTEELWDFVKKEKVESFDFKQAQHLAIRKTRDFALAYCGGSK